jgi:hypothetical protein
MSAWSLTNVVRGIRSCAGHSVAARVVDTYKLAV